MSARPFFIVPTDGSRESDAVLSYAGSLAKARSADLHVVQVVRRPGSLWDAPAAEVELRARLRRARTLLAKQGVAVRIVTLRGSPARAIAAYAHVTAPALVVVGRQYAARAPWRASSVSRRLSRMSAAPVLVVPPGLTTAVPLTRILAAVDGADQSLAVMRAASDVAGRHDARVTLFRAIEGPRDFVFTAGEAMRLLNRLHDESKAEARRLTDGARALGARDPDAVVLTGPPHRGILRTAESTDADLIVVGGSPRSRLDEIVFGSTLRPVLRRATVPVLIVPTSPPAAHTGVAGALLSGTRSPAVDALQRAA